MMRDSNFHILHELTRTSKIQLKNTQTWYDKDITPQLLQLLLEQKNPKMMGTILLEHEDIRRDFQILVADLTFACDCTNIPKIDKYWSSAYESPIYCDNRVSNHWWLIDTTPRVSMCMLLYGDSVRIQLNVGSSSRGSTEYAGDMRIKALATLACICYDNPMNSHFIPWNASSRYKQIIVPTHTESNLQSVEMILDGCKIVSIVFFFPVRCRLT